MPLYRTLCISAHYNDFKHIKDLVTQSATLLLENGGVVRAIENMGIRTLPQRMYRHKAWHYHGNYWAISFDASPQLASQLAQRLRSDPRVVRWTTRKLGVTLSSLSPSSPSAPGGSLPGQTVRLLPPLSRLYSAGTNGSNGVAANNRYNNNNNPITGVYTLGDDTDNIPLTDEGDQFGVQESLLHSVPMAPQQRAAIQEAARRRAFSSSGSARNGRRNFSTTSTNTPPLQNFAPLNRSQARLETRWLEGHLP